MSPMVDYGGGDIRYVPRAKILDAQGNRLTSLVPQPVVPVGTKPTPASFGGPATVPGDWWNGLIACIPFWEGAGDNLVELVTGDKSTDIASATWSQGSDGPVITASGGEIDFAENSTHDGKINNALSSFVYVKATSTDNVVVGVGKAYNSGHTNPYFQYAPFYKGTGVNDNKNSFRIGSNVITTASAFWGDPDTEFVPYGVSWDGSNVVHYKSGAFFSTQALSATITDRDFGLTVNGNVAGGEVFDGETAVAYIWNRALTAIEHLELALDPYAPFRSYTLRTAGQH